MAHLPSPGGCRCGRPARCAARTSSASKRASAGKAATTTATPAMQARPPEVTEKRGLVSPATVPDSTSPSRGPLVTTSEKTDDMRPRIASGVTIWLIELRHTALTLSAAPAIASSTAAGHSERDDAHERDRGAPHDDRPDDDHPQPPRVLDPPRGQRGDGRARRHGGVEQPGPLGARAVDADREHGEQRARHAEGHRDEVDGERADERVVAAHVAQAVGDRAQHRRVLGDVGLRRLRRHHDHGDDHRQAARRVDRVGRADAEHADEHAADARAR